MKKFIVGMCFLVGSTVVCLADQPTCTGDRHYDTAGNCVAIDPPTGKCSDGSVCECGTKCPNGQDCLPCDTPTTTSTTLPQICPPTACICVPNEPTVTVVAPCPSLTCPEIKFPNYVFCRVVRKSHRHPNGVKCRTPKNPHSLWVPATDSVDGAQVG